MFEAERQRELDEAPLDDRATGVAAPREDRRRAGGPAPAARRPSTPSAEVVEASKALYLSAVDNAVRAARRVKHWTDVGRLRREQAAALFAEAGSPVPPPDDIVALHKESRGGAAARARADRDARRADRRRLLQGLPRRRRQGRSRSSRSSGPSASRTRAALAGCARASGGCRWPRRRAAAAASPLLRRRSSTAGATADPRASARRARPWLIAVGLRAAAPRRRSSRRRRRSPGP